MTEAVSERNLAAHELFAPIAETYDRYARVLSLGQDPRWRRFLVSRIGARSSDTILDVACGTGAVALELVRRYGCAVVGVDQSGEMLAAGRRRIDAAGLAHRIDLRRARAEELPFGNASFDGLTFTYLLRYVDDPAATLGELARVVRPGGRIAMLDFYLPRNPAVRMGWDAYVRVGLPLLGRLISPGWGAVGGFLGGSIETFWRHRPVERLLELWRAAGVVDVAARPLSLGGAIVVWGIRGG